jgi:hypothetical protein
MMMMVVVVLIMMMIMMMMIVQKSTSTFSYFSSDFSCPMGVSFFTHFLITTDRNNDSSNKRPRKVHSLHSVLKSRDVGRKHLQTAAPLAV